MTTSNRQVWWQKWDNAARRFDLMNAGIELRYGDTKRDWFSRAKGKILLVAVGTGLDLQYFASDQEVTGVDISAKMLQKAKDKIEAAHSQVTLVRTDVQSLGFPDSTFDTIVTSCTFCSVPDPIKGLKELYRVLKSEGKLLMFEHVRSSIFWMGPMMDLMTLASRRFGPDLNRKTGDNLSLSGFKITREVNVYLDMVKLFEAKKSQL